MFLVTRGKRVVAGANGIGVPPLALPVLDADFAAATVMDDLFGP